LSLFNESFPGSDFYLVWYVETIGMSPEEELIKRTEFFSPPDICFNSIPFALTLERQYIIKNIFLIGAAFVIGSKVSENG